MLYETTLLLWPTYKFFKGTVRNVVARNVKLDRVTNPVHVYQTNDAKS